MTLQQPEVWLRGPLNNTHSLVQPVAHALLQAREEVQYYASDFPSSLLWICPAGKASVGFHLQHLTGVLDRLFTYASERALTEEQLYYLQSEGKEDFTLTTKHLLQNFDFQIDKSLVYLSQVNPETLSHVRSVGRKNLPSTHLGLLVHAAEHTQRHIGQLLVTIPFVKHLSNYAS